MKLQLLFVLGMITAVVNAQNLNQTDTQGRKQGQWKKNYDSSQQLRYEGQFKDNQPVGTFKYYDRSGKLQSTVEHRGAGVSYGINYQVNGKRQSEGKFINQKKDSTWTFYSSDETVLSREDYSADQKHGKSVVYHSNGTPVMEQNFTKGVVNGKLTAWFENGKIKSEDNYLNGVLTGPSRSYNEKGMLVLEGVYENGNKVGDWSSYNEDGSKRAIYTYKGEKMTIKRLNGVFEDLYPNELVKGRYTYKDGKKNGPFTEYHSGGVWKDEERTDARTGEKDTYRVPVNHHVSKKGTYYNDVIHGKLELFGTNGTPGGVQNYNLGKLQ